MFSPSTKLDFQVLHEATGGDPEVITHQGHALQSPTVTVEQGLHQLRVLFATPRVQPLLELVQHDADLGVLRDPRSFADPGQHVGQRQLLGDRGESPSQSFEQTQLRVLGGRLQIHGHDVRRESGQQARLHQRRLATAAGTVDQADAERLVGIRLFDAELPESDALGQSVTVPCARQQLQEEVRVVLVERTQALGHDAQGLLLVGLGIAGDRSGTGRLRTLWRGRAAMSAACSPAGR